MKQGWKIKNLGEVCEIVNGSTPLRTNKDFWDNGNYPWFTIDDIREQGRVINHTKQKVTDKALKKLRVLPVDAILLCCTASIGEYAITKIELTTNQQFNGLVIKDKQELLPMFLYHFSSTLKDALSNLSGKATIDFIPISRLKNIEIQLPPISEQKEIVAILDKAFADIAKAKNNAEQNLKNAKELFESYLQNVFSNKGASWEEKALGEVSDTGAGGTPLKSHKDYYENGDVPWLRSGEVNKKDIIECEMYISEKGLKNSSARMFPVNTVLVAMYGATAGQVGILRFECSTNQAVCGILPNKDFIPEFIYYKFLSAEEDLVKQAVGGAQPNISQIKIKNTLVPVISIKEQQDVVKKLDNLSVEIKKLENIYQQKIKDLDELKKSILQKAFDGELKSVKV